MSEFDKEAEREKLREKYEKDRQDRQATQRMSDLLLRGATMTNRHCDACGDPIFRYEGQEFCPSCQSENGGPSPSTADTGAVDRSPDIEETATDSTSEAARAVADEERTDPVDTASQPSEVREPEPGSEATPHLPTDAPDQAAERRGTPEPDASNARAELDRAIATLARRAAESDDPRRAREFLEAAREAAETVSTLEHR
ncbi:MAG: Sjogren's syndrome/scleroderma autoantigen 1 family protein [Halalkalicoccus sp.]